MNDFTIICIYNDESILNNNLKASIENIKEDIPSYFIDNSGKYFTSMSQAYNSIISRVNTKWVIMVHQDIYFPLSTWNRLRIFIDEMNNKKCGMIGVAGCKSEIQGVFSNIKYGPNLINAGEFIVDKYVSAQTIDECFMLARTDILKKYPFDEKVCNGWHLYGVDRCLEFKLLGFENYVLGLDMEHHSKRVSMNASYFVILRKILNKYKENYKVINTTCGTWRVNDMGRVNWLLFKERIKEVFQRRA